MPIVQIAGMAKVKSRAGGCDIQWSGGKFGRIAMKRKRAQGMKGKKTRYDFYAITYTKTMTANQ